MRRIAAGIVSEDAHTKKGRHGLAPERRGEGGATTGSCATLSVRSRRSARARAAFDRELQEQLKAQRQAEREARALEEGERGRGSMRILIAGKRSSRSARTS